MEGEVPSTPETDLWGPTSEVTSLRLRGLPSRGRIYFGGSSRQVCLQVE